MGKTFFFFIEVSSKFNVIFLIFGLNQALRLVDKLGFGFELGRAQHLWPFDNFSNVLAISCTLAMWVVPNIAEIIH